MTVLFGQKSINSHNGTNEMVHLFFLTTDNQHPIYLIDVASCLLRVVALKKLNFSPHNMPRK